MISDTTGVSSRQIPSPRVLRTRYRMPDSMKPSPVDVEVVSATSPSGQGAVVTAAFEQYHAELYSYLRRSTRDESAAEDLMQEAFLRLFKEVETGRTPDNVRAWLYRVGSNLAISRGRRRRTALDWMSRYGRAGGSADSPESDVLGRERTAALDAVLADLPVDDRTALLLSAQGFSGEEIAQAIGRSNGATRTMLCRARVRVRLELERRGDVR
jgi:RNA polymerase sigma-70 factor, ECF subfamily